MNGSDPYRWMVKHFDWTPDRCAKLAQMWADGLSGREIAEFFGNGLSRSAVIGKAHRMKLPGRDGESLRLTSRRKARNEARGRRQAAVNNQTARQSPKVAPWPAKRLAPLPMPQEGPKSPSAVTLDALDANREMCRWVYQEGGATLFCGCKTVPGTSWCPSHHAKVFRQFDPIPLKRREINHRQVTFYERESEDA